MRAAILLLFALCSGCLGPGAAFAASLETLVMPGPVIEGHADIESDCSQCHRPFEAEAENGLCLDCHEDVAADLEAKQGYHGLAPGIAEAQCRSCHTDHQGRDADVLGLNEALFDHALTDYPLHGAHRGVPCGSCHEPDDKHRDAPSDCVSCHRNDDIHKGTLGDQCGDCHVDTGWAKAEFDHDTTDFPLEGAHDEVACGLCHADERYEGTPTECSSCHVIDDVHKGSFGTACESCHGVVEWKKIDFDHDSDTTFALTGKHAQVSCVGCHPTHLYDDPAPTSCNGCHSGDDVHRGRNGTDCADCHDTRRWSGIDFDHDRDTEFPLRGEHASLACEGCHTGNLYEEELGTECQDCHAKDDVHRGEQGTDCGRCHAEQGWNTKLRFDHDLTRFPLLGLHATVSCEQCHASQQFHDVDQACVDCHATDDVHETRLGPDCQSCHNPNGWAVWRFDHDVQTNFALHGGHSDLSCESCHKSAIEDPAHAEAILGLGERCIDCHRKDDKHRGAFGTRCEQCHVEERWTDVTLPGAPPASTRSR